MSGDNICIWELEKDLDEIAPLLQQQNSKIEEVLIDAPISKEDKQYIYKWVSVPDDGFEKQVQVINNKEVEFISTVAELEVPSIARKKMIGVNGQPISKSLRVNKQHSNVLFVNRDGKVYCIVRGSKSLEGRIRSNLMDSRKKKESKWGNITTKDVNGYTFNKSFYYWMLHHKGTPELTHGIKKMKLLEVKGFKCDSERRTSTYAGQGSNIDNEIPLKSLICIDQKLISLYISILYEKCTYSFYLDCDGRITVFWDECGEHATQNPHPIDEDEILLNIYFDIIPFLIQEFNVALKNGWDKVEIDFRQESAIDVIRKLMLENEISISHLKKDSNQENIG